MPFFGFHLVPTHWLRHLTVSIENLHKQGATIMSKLDDIQAEADQIRDGVTTLITKVNDEAAKIADLTAQLGNAAGDQAKIDAISAELTDTVGKLQAATADATPPDAGTISA